MKNIPFLLLTAIILTGCSDKADQPSAGIEDKTGSPGSEVQQQPAENQTEPENTVPALIPLDLSLPDSLPTGSPHTVADEPANKLPNLFEKEEKDADMSILVTPILETDEETESIKVDGATIDVEIKID